jgi:flagellar motor switch protein FliG
MTKTEKREIAKELLMEALSLAYYKLENDIYNHISQEEQEEICEYMRQYGEAMAKRINKKYYTQ